MLNFNKIFISSLSLLLITNLNANSQELKVNERLTCQEGCLYQKGRQLSIVDMNVDDFKYEKSIISKYQDCRKKSL